MQKNKRMVRKILLFLGVLLVFLTISQREGEVRAASIPKLKVTNKTLYIGYNTHTIEVNNLTKNATVTYKSSNKKIAVVSNKGKVTPLAAGTVKISITIKQNNKTYKSSLNVTVKKPYVTITKKTNEVLTGESFQFQAKVYGSKDKVKWSVSNQNVASINSSTGELTGTMNGTVTVTATAGSLKKSCNVRITAPPKQELVISGENSMIVGETFTYKIINDPYMADWWDISDYNIADLGEGNGEWQEVVALKAGTFKITAKTPDAYGEKTVQVKDIQIIGNPIISVAGTSTFTVNSKQLQRKAYWIIEDEEIAEIYEDNGNGVSIRGLKEGSTILTLAFSGSEIDHTVNIEIQVGEAAEFTISGKSSINIDTSEEYRVNLPSDANVAWSISNTSKAKISGYGNCITLLVQEEGTYYLTASVGSKKAVFEITVDGESDTELPDFTTDETSGSDNQGGNTNNGNNSENTPGNTKQITKNGVIYELRGTYAYVAGVVKGTKVANILSKVEGLPVTTIGKTFGQATTLQSVTWSGDSITLEEECFYNNRSLTSITLQGSITIGIRALANCTSLTLVTFTGEVKRVGAMAFAGSTSLEKLTIAGNQTIYENGTFYASYGPFYGCSSLKVLRLESKMVFLSDYAKQNFFYGLGNESMESNLEELYLNVDQIDSRHFLKYISDNLRKVTLKNTTRICNGAFQNFERLEEIYIPASTVTIEDAAFYDCYNLTTVRAEVNRARTFQVENVFHGTKFESLGGCYLYGAQDILGMEEYSILQKAISVISNIKAKTANNYEIIKGAHDWVVRNTAYDYVNYVEGTVPSSSFRESGVFLYGTAVCEGYTKAFGLLMTIAGIENHFVVGFANNGATSDGHAWNIVKLDGTYYHVDTTWDDPTWSEDAIRYDYFLISDAQMSIDHEWQYSGTSYPSCPRNYK